MSAGDWRVKPSEVERTLKSVKKAGLRVTSVEVSADGLIRIMVAEPDAKDDTSPDESDGLKKLI
ncbi:hypothetical protein [Bradyrhizobium sp. CCBAU 53380]|uniref:hypothetical protein n=1 Tax=Bradyrhizobium sp. CCBAU 53380 TaxID=1325117 RepID=UPI002303EA98|nr:hypothetical protein [Bradyrhizobium sp. CCBAU 53380]MDA9424034.1 hypothetical protein [Bradyrhizobium sp. CCBAU 53380]